MPSQRKTKGKTMARLTTLAALACMVTAPAAAQSTITLEDFDLGKKKPAAAQPAPETSPSRAPSSEMEKCLLDQANCTSKEFKTKTNFSLDDVVNLGVIDHEEAKKAKEAQAKDNTAAGKPADTAQALPSIDIDYRAACRHAGGLLKRKGHDRVLLCLPESSTGGEAASEAGFREGYKGDVAGSLSILKHNGTPEHLRSLLDRHLSARKPPVGIVVARAIHALTVLTYFLERGIRPGCDLSLISRDDEPFLDHVCPRITRYSVDPSTFQRKLVQAALRLVENRSALPRPVRLIPTYLPGETA